MKYLKTFEELGDDIKRYFIINSASGYMIIEKLRIWLDVDEKDEDKKTKIEIKQLYIYGSRLIKISDSMDSFNFSLGFMKRKIVYQSDNLQECMDELKDIKTRDKYNL